jgi:hypothetical protein
VGEESFDWKKVRGRKDAPAAIRYFGQEILYLYMTADPRAQDETEMNRRKAVLGELVKKAVKAEQWLRLLFAQNTQPLSDGQADLSPSAIR